jgi:hypothetical protein
MSKLTACAGLKHTALKHHKTFFLPNVHIHQAKDLYESCGTGNGCHHPKEISAIQYKNLVD